MASQSTKNVRLRKWHARVGLRLFARLSEPRRQDADVVASRQRPVGAVYVGIVERGLHPATCVLQRFEAIGHRLRLRIFDDHLELPRRHANDDLASRPACLGTSRRTRCRLSSRHPRLAPSTNAPSTRCWSAATTTAPARLRSNSSRLPMCRLVTPSLLVRSWRNSTSDVCLIWLSCARFRLKTATVPIVAVELAALGVYDELACVPVGPNSNAGAAV